MKANNYITHRWENPLEKNQYNVTIEQKHIFSLYLKVSCFKIYHILFLIFISYINRQNQVCIKKVRIRIFSKFPFKEGKPNIKMTECSKERGLHSEIYVVSNFQYQFSITCKNCMHKVSELLSKIYNLSPKCSHTHSHTHTTYKEKPLKILGIREEKATVNFFRPQSKHFCLHHTFNNLPC